MPQIPSGNKLSVKMDIKLLSPHTQVPKMTEWRIGNHS